MYEDVMVVKVLKTGSVSVSCPKSACSTCKGASFCNNKGELFEAKNSKNLSLSAGMKVRLYLKPSRTIMSSLITLFFPLLFFPISYLLAKRWGSGEGVAILVGLCFVAIGFLLAWLYFSKTKGKYTPVVDEILDDSSSL